MWFANILPELPAWKSTRTFHIARIFRRLLSGRSLLLQQSCGKQSDQRPAADVSRESLNSVGQAQDCPMRADWTVVLVGLAICGSIPGKGNSTSTGPTSHERLPWSYGTYAALLRCSQVAQRQGTDSMHLSTWMLRSSTSTIVTVCLTFSSHYFAVAK